MKTYTCPHMNAYLDAWGYLVRVGVSFQYCLTEMTISVDLTHESFTDDPSIQDRLEEIIYDKS